MKLSPREQESLLVHQVGVLAQLRLARGVRLNYTEAVGLIASQIQELIRDGDNTVAELMSKGRQMLGYRQVQPGVPEMIGEVQVEGTFRDGTKLVTVHKPVCNTDGDLGLAFYGSFLPVPELSVFDISTKGTLNSSVDANMDVVPGQLEVDEKAGPVVLNAGRKLTCVKVTSVCDRPIQIGSHYHFIEANKALSFDRQLAYGMRLNIPAGTAIRFEPGETKVVTLVEIAGERVIRGGNFLCDGPVQDSVPAPVIAKIGDRGFGHQIQHPIKREPQVAQMSRINYAHTFGPTTGDKMRLGDTELFIEVEKDFTVYGDECKFGGGKVGS